MSIRSLICVCSIAAILAVPSVGMTWSDVRVFKPVVKTNGHAFYGVWVGEEGCALLFKLHYFAPKDLYTNKEVFKFRAKISFFSGGSVHTRSFTNTKTGNRIYAGSRSTKRRGCWARGKERIKSLHVVSCSGKKCKLPKLR